MVVEEGWPWCDHCQSYHHPKNPTCRRGWFFVRSLQPFGRWRTALDLPWSVWFVIALLLWILADVAPGYHKDSAVAAHDLYTYSGGVAFVAALRRFWVDVRS